MSILSLLGLSRDAPRSLTLPSDPTGPHGCQALARVGRPRSQCRLTADTPPRPGTDLRRARQPAESCNGEKPNTSGRGCGLWVDAALTDDNRGTQPGPLRIESHDGMVMARIRTDRAGPV